VEKSCTTPELGDCNMKSMLLYLLTPVSIVNNYFFNYSTTWDEHVFELTLPRSCCVGHVDVKFSLHSLPSMATEIQVTLLKLNTSGIGKKEKPPGSRAVDDGINFKFSGMLIKEA